MAERRICHVFATFGPGGPQVRTSAILNALPPGWRHSVIAVDGNFNCRDRLRPELRTEYADPERGRWGPFYPLHLARKVKRLRPDLLITYNWGSMDAVIGAAALRVRPWIHTEDGFGPDEAVVQKGRRVWTRRLFLRGAHAVVVCSRNLERIATGIWRLPAEKVRLIPNGVDTDRFSPGSGLETRALLGIPDDAVVVGTVGHVRGEKDPLRLLHAFHAVAAGTARLLYVGSGPLLDPLRARSRELGLEGRVHFAGHAADTAPFHRAIDIFALSSNTEQLPVALLEAMATGRPAVSTDVGDVKWAVSDANKEFVASATDEEAYRSSLRRLLGDPDLRARLGAANLERARRDFRHDDMVRSYLRLYEEAIGTGD